MIHNGQAGTHHEGVFCPDRAGAGGIRHRQHGARPRYVLGLCWHQQLLLGAVRPRSRKPVRRRIATNYETLVRRPTKLMVDRRHWRNILRAEEVSFCTKPKPVASSCFVPQKDGRHRSKGVLFSGDPNIPRAVRYVDLLERAIRCNP